MISVTLNGNSYKVCTKWEEVDINKLESCEGFKDELKALTTIPPELIDKYTNEQLWPIYTLISFIDDFDLMPFHEATDIERRWYVKFEAARAGTLTGKPYRKIIKAAKAYYPKETDPVKLIGLGVSIIHQISVFLANYQDMTEDEPGQDEKAAGIEELSGFGSFGTAYTLAGKDLLKLKDIYHMSLIEVYTALYFSWKEAKYQKKLFDIRNPKKPKV
jgi:hypothetical protein